MADNELPHVLIIDDREGQGAFRNELQVKELATAEVRHPQEVEHEDLVKAQLVLVDYQLDNWPERDGLEAVALKPIDGLALAGILRRAAHESEKASPTAFAIHTGQIDKLASPLPAEHREHALARINNVEWIFKKASDEERDRRAIQVAELASAVLKLPRLWSGSQGRTRLEQLAELLDIKSQEEVREDLLADIEGCLPPIHELSQWSHGLAVLRWLLHRILPYPCFLWDSHHLAARVRLDHSDLTAELEKGRPLQKALMTCEYSGILCRFAGMRWWRNRLELELWELTGARSADAEEVAEVICRLAGRRIKRSEPAEHPVVCLNTNYQPLDKFAALTDAVRIQPDDWPSYADHAWTTIELARSEPKLRAIVAREEAGRLEGHNG